jgi:hypothetical protein
VDSEKKDDLKMGGLIAGVTALGAIFVSLISKDKKKDKKS